MKKIILLLITLLTATFANAQNVSGVFANNGSVNIVETNSDTEAAAIRVSGNHTMEAWVKAANTERGYVMSMGTANSFRGAYRIETVPTTGKAIVAYAPAISGTDFFNVTTTAVICDGTWHHIAVVGTTSLGTTSTKIYVDGVLDATTVPNYTRPTTWTNAAGMGGTMQYSSVGGRGTNTTTDVYFNGEIDEARFWTVARTQTQIQQQSCVITDATGLYREIKLDSNINDSSVNAKATTSVGAGVSSYGTGNCPSTWTGTTNTSWSTASNWRLRALPNQNSDVTIATAANQPVIASAVSIKSLTLNASTTLAVSSGTLTVAEAIVNNGSMSIANNANLVQTALANTNSGSGTATVTRNSNPLLRFDYTMWSSPVNGGQTLEQFSPNTSRIPNRFYTHTYTDPNNRFENIATTSTFTPGLGYLIRMPNDADTGTPTPFAGVFTGTLFNNGTITLSGLAADKYYSVGNPYPSTLDAAEFITANPGTLYFWRKTNGAAGTAYATYNTVGPVAAGSGIEGAGSAAPNGTIQVGQGFIAKTGIAGTLVFTNAMRNGTVSTQFFRTKNVTEKSRLWLNLTNTAGIFSQALVGYLDGATTGIDVAYDGAYINDSATALTSIVDGGEYTIQGRPAFDATDVVALGFKTDVAGDFTIAVDKKDGVLAAQDIYLVDSKTGAETDLNTSAYTFTAEAGVDNARFSLKYQKTLKVIDATLDNNNVSVYQNNGAIYINSKSAAIRSVKVFDVQGRLIAEQTNVKANTAVISNLRAKNQLLIVNVIGEDNSKVSKKVMN